MTLIAVITVTVTPAEAVTSGPYFIKFGYSGKCIDVPNSSTANVQLDQYSCVNATNEQFYLDYLTGTTFRVRSRSSGKCLNFNGGSTATGTAIIQYTCGSYANETFVNLTINSTAYAYLSGTGSYGTVEIPSSGTHPSTANNAKLIEGTVSGEDANAFILWCKTLSSCSNRP